MSDATPNQPAPASADASATTAPAGAEPAAPEPAVDAAAVADPPKVDPWDERFEKLTAKSAEIRRQESALKSAQDAAQKHAKLTELAKTNRLEAIRELGINVDDLLVDVIGADAQKPADPVAEVRAEVERLKAEREAEITARKKAEQDAWYADYYRNVEAKVRDAGDKYEALNAFGKQSDVARIIEGFFSQTGQVLPFEEAAELAENKALEFARRASGIKKLAPATSARQQAQTVTQAPGGVRTLSNAMSETPKPAPTKQPVLTREESLRRAVELVESGQSPWLNETADA